MGLSDVSALGHIEPSGLSKLTLSGENFPVGKFSPRGERSSFLLGNFGYNVPDNVFTALVTTFIPSYVTRSSNLLVVVAL